MKKEYLISVDLGGTKILSALINNNNEIIYRDKQPTKIGKGPKHIVKNISQSIQKILKENNLDQSQIEAISLGVPGTVNPHSGLISVAPNLGIVNFNIKESLAEEFQIPVLIENDVNIAGLGIKIFELNNEVKNMLVVFVGTGIGGSLFIDGQLYRGSSYFAGEIGHMKVDENGKFSGDKSLTFENIASRTGIVNSIISDIKHGKKSQLSEFVSKNRKIKSKAIASAIESKDKVVIKNIDKGCRVIGTVLGSLTTLLNVDTIVLGGGLLEASGDYMLPKIKDAFNNSVLKAPGEIVQIVVTKLGDDAPLYGGIALAEEFLSV